MLTIKYDPKATMSDRYRFASAMLKSKILQDQRNGHPVPTPEQCRILLRRLAETGTTKERPEPQ